MGLFLYFVVLFDFLFKIGVHQIQCYTYLRGTLVCNGWQSNLGMLYKVSSRLPFDSTGNSHLKIEKYIIKFDMILGKIHKIN